MSQTTETQPTNAELAGKVVGAVTAVQDAEAVLVEGAKRLAAHIADPNAHGTDVTACVAQAVADHDGNEGAHDGTFVKAGDARLSDARTPKPHKATHQSGGADALAPADIGAAPASHTSVAASASALGHVKYGTAAGTACQGNDSRLSNARTPTAHKESHKSGGADALAPEDIGAASVSHKESHKTGGADALTPADIGAAPASHTNVAASASALGHVKYGTAAGTACQGNDSRLSNARTPTAHASTATTYGAASATQYGHAKASGTTPKAAGTAAVGAETDAFARGDHVHPVQTTVSGNAGSATKLATARTIDGVSFNGSANITHYGSCATEAATAAKVVACTGFVLAAGSRITVRFTVTNTAASPTLNVNSTGAKAIRYRNAAISAGYLAANRTYDFVYDGTYYQLVGDVDSNTTYTPAAAAPKAAGTAAVGTS
uniref:hypothetical protein n=1 Tax=uncultured Bilophila sp. TaxID=529385 RepID=UPI00261FE783